MGHLPTFPATLFLTRASGTARTAGLVVRYGERDGRGRGLGVRERLGAVLFLRPAPARLPRLKSVLAI